MSDFTTNLIKGYLAEFTQKINLARRSGVATVTVQKLEEGRIRDPRGSTLAKLAAVLGCSVESLLGYKGQQRSRGRR